jgi:SNF2 family DNA or RNA helicase
MLLSGTALTGKPKDLLNQLELLGILDTHFGGFYQFAVDFCDGRRNDAGFFEYDGSSNEQELHRKLSQTCMVRRIKRNVLPDLPTKQRSVVYAEISNRAKYEKAEKDFISAIRTNIEERAVKAVMIKLELQKAEQKKDYKAPTKEQFADLVAAEASSITYRTESASNLTEFTVLKKIANEGKERGAIEWVKNYFEDADDSMPLVAFPYTRKLQKKMYEACVKAGLRVGSITADQTADERFEQQQRFQNGEFDVMVASLMIASTNLTLTAASTAFFPELTDNADDFVQAEDRILRIGSEGDSVECAYLFADNTVDIDIWERHTNKVQVMDLVMDGQIVENDMTKLESKYLSKLIEQAAA